MTGEIFGSLELLAVGSGMVVGLPVGIVANSLVAWLMSPPLPLPGLRTAETPGVLVTSPEVVLLSIPRRLVILPLSPPPPLPESWGGVASTPSLVLLPLPSKPDRLGLGAKLVLELPTLALSPLPEATRVVIVLPVLLPELMAPCGPGVCW